MLATTFSASPTRTQTGQRRLSITKPDVVVRYNNAMGGVDLADQYILRVLQLYVSDSEVDTQGDVLGNRSQYSKQLHLVQNVSDHTHVSPEVPTGDNSELLQYFPHRKCETTDDDLGTRRATYPRNTFPGYRTILLSLPSLWSRESKNDSVLLQDMLQPPPSSPCPML